MKTIDVNELVTVQCRTCRKWLCVWPQGYTGPESSLPHPVVGGRILGFCYCTACISTRPMTCRPATKEDDSSPWSADAIRAMEGE